MSQPKTPKPDGAPATPAAEPPVSLVVPLSYPPGPGAFRPAPRPGAPPPRAGVDTLAGDDVAGHGDDGRDTAPTPARDPESPEEVENGDGAPAPTPGSDPDPRPEPALEPQADAAADADADDTLAGHGDDGRDTAPTPVPDLETLARDHPQVRELLYELQRARAAATGVPGDDIVATGDTGRDTAPPPARDPESPDRAPEKVENGDGTPTPGSEPDLRPEHALEPRANAAAEADADDVLAHDYDLPVELEMDFDAPDPETTENGDGAPASTEPRANAAAEADADDVLAHDYDLPVELEMDFDAPDPETTENGDGAPASTPVSRPTPEPAPRPDPVLEPRADAGAEDIRQALRNHAADFSRWREVERRGRRLAGSLALALSAPLCLLCGLLLGLLVQTHFAVLTVPDPTGGWKDHVWRLHGQTLVDCTARARADGAAVSCPVTIEAP